MNHIVLHLKPRLHYVKTRRLKYFQISLFKASCARHLNEKVEIDFKRASSEASSARRSDEIVVQENLRALSAISSVSRPDALC